MAVCLLVRLALHPVSAAPRIHVPSPRVEIGTLTAGETVEAEFSFANIGTEVLKIFHVAASCGCATTSYPETLPPGGRGTLKVKLVSSPLWSGAVEKQITLHSNDPDRPAVTLQLVAQARPLFQIAPENPVSINYNRGDIIRQVFTITPVAKGNTRIAGVVPAGPRTEARLLPPESSDPPGTFRVEVTARPPDGGGDFSTSATLQTTHPRVPTVPLVLIGVSQDAITVSPSFLYLGRLAANPASCEPRVLVLFKRSGNFRVLGVQSDSPALQAELREPPTPGANGGRNYAEITVRYVGGWATGERTGKIVVTTDDPQSPTLEVPYQAKVE